MKHYSDSTFSRPPARWTARSLEGANIPMHKSAIKCATKVGNRLPTEARTAENITPTTLVVNMPRRP